MNKYKAHYEITEFYIEIYFDEFPDEKIIETMKICGWHYFGKKKCWSIKKAEENIIFAKSICNRENDNEQIRLNDNLEHYYFETDSTVLIRTNSFYCNSHHQLIDIMGGFWVVSKLGKVDMHWVPLAYCESCGLYYILKETYNDLKKYGVILCEMMTYEQYTREGEFNNDFDKWKKIGPLKRWGYSVSVADGLTEIQREMILEDIIDYEVMKKDEVLSYIDFFIWLNGNNNPNAVNKWESDRRHISKYRGKSIRVVFS